MYVEIFVLTKKISGNLVIDRSQVNRRKFTINKTVFELTFFVFIFFSNSGAQHRFEDCCGQFLGGLSLHLNHLIP